MVSSAGPRPICLYGDVVRDDGAVARRQYVVMVDGRIQSVGSGRPDGVTRVDYTLAADEMIFPSFLDLHTHTSYNMLPLWHSPYWAWDNRFQWRANADYRQTIGATNRAIVARAGDKSKIHESFTAFSELMAMAGGTTVLQEDAHLDGEGFPKLPHILIRGTGTPTDIGLQPNEDVASVLEFYEPDAYPGNPYQDTSRWKVKSASGFSGSSYVSAFAQSVSGARTRGTIVHVAEGRSGFLQTKLGVDAYTRAEFETFKDFITAYSNDRVQLVRDARLALIHGCGMDTSRKADTVAFLKTYGIGLIWSPVSNLLLYQDTTNVLPLLDAGVPVALGTDWTPSGSKNVWEEAKFAADFLETVKWRGNVNLTCLRAVTSTAADMLGLPLGRVKAGNFADVVILRRPRGVKRGDALQTFRQAGDAEVRAVLVAGVPMYGERDVLEALGADPIPLPDEAAPRGSRGDESVARSKALVLPRGCGLTIAELTRGLQTADQIVGVNRPRLLAADDPDYLTRMAELRAWVRGFAKTGPTPKPKPPRPSGLAPGELEWMYNPGLDPKNRPAPEVVDLLGRIAPCRDGRCAVPQNHPYYHAEMLTEAGDSYGFRVPCMPVVPVLTNREQLFVMGDFPTAKFTARSTNCLPVITGSPDSITAANDQLKALLGNATAQPTAAPHLLQTYIEELDDLVRGAFARPDIVPKNGHASRTPAPTPPRKNEFFAPVGDLFAPLQDANYFDGYKARNIAAGVFFQEQYLAPVGVQVSSQVWLTNMIKCFLFHGENAAAYQTLGWTDVRVEQTYSELYTIGKVCSQWISEEVRVCKPRLVVTLGKPPSALLHNVMDDTALQGRVYNELMGVKLPANDSRLEVAVARVLKLTSHGRRVSIARRAPWSRYNVFHMMHPQAVMMAQTAVSSAMVLAMQMMLGPKADGMSVDALTAAMAKFVQKHGTGPLITALPYGQRDALASNATLLERHAVMMADLADTIQGLRLVKDRSLDGDTVLAQQAQALAGSFHLAASAGAELKRLKQQRAAHRARIAKYLRARGN